MFHGNKMDEMELLKSGARELGVELSPGQLTAFGVYLSELLKWNARVNLTSITSPRDIVIKHFLDSLALCRLIPAGELLAVDIGSGAGFPGLAVKVACPRTLLTLIEPAHKKAAFLRHAARLMGLTGVSVVESRVETLLPPASASSPPVSATSPPVSATCPPAPATCPPTPATCPPTPATSPPTPSHGRPLDSIPSLTSPAPEGPQYLRVFDAVFSRAFRSPLELLPVAYPFLKPGGAVYLSLGPKTQDLEKIPAGWELLRCEELTLPFSDYQRTLISLKKQ